MEKYLGNINSWFLWLSKSERRPFFSAGICLASCEDLYSLCLSNIHSNAVLYHSLFLVPHLDMCRPPPHSDSAQASSWGQRQGTSSSWQHEAPETVSPVWHHHLCHNLCHVSPSCLVTSVATCPDHTPASTVTQCLCCHAAVSRYVMSSRDTVKRCVTPGQ